MHGAIKYFLCLLTGILYQLTGMAQQSDSLFTKPDTAENSVQEFIIGEVIITGNKKTKASIILREVPFQSGDSFSLQTLVKKFEVARRQLMNTTLFHSVVVSLKEFRGFIADVSIVVKERWYLFPLPYFKPVDRNLNQWLVEQKGSLKRVNYGIKLLYNNATGRNDKLKLYLINGYTKQISLEYDRLYFDKRMKWGGVVTLLAGKNREMNYNTVNDKQVFLRHDEFVRQFFSTKAEVSYRRAIKTRHSFGVGFTREQVHDTITTLNPGYFRASKKSVAFPEIYYKMVYFNLDYIPYPTKGYAAQINFAKKGFGKGIDLWELNVKGLATWPIMRKTFLNLNTFGGLKLPFRQSYYTQRLFGYGDVYLQGYEYYVTDGVAGGFMKATLAREILSFKIRIPGSERKGKQAEYIPFRIFGKIYGNAGYVHNPQPGENTLSNKMLYSSGIGIDILSFYDVVFKLEWSFNQLGQNGLFLHKKTIF